MKIPWHYGLSCVPPNSYLDVLTLSISVPYLETVTSQQSVMQGTVIRMALVQCDCVLIRGLGDRHAHRENPCDHEDGCLKAQARPAASPAAPGCWRFSPRTARTRSGQGPAVTLCGCCLPAGPRRSGWASPAGSFLGSEGGQPPIYTG